MKKIFPILTVILLISAACNSGVEGTPPISQGPERVLDGKYDYDYYWLAARIENGEVNLDELKYWIRPVQPLVLIREKTTEGTPVGQSGWEGQSLGLICGTEGKNYVIALTSMLPGKDDIRLMILPPTMPPSPPGGPPVETPRVPLLDKDLYLQFVASLIWGKGIVDAEILYPDKRFIKEAEEKLENGVTIKYEYPDKSLEVILFERVQPGSYPTPTGCQYTLGKSGELRDGLALKGVGYFKRFFNLTIENAELTSVLIKENSSFIKDSITWDDIGGPLFAIRDGFPELVALVSATAVNYGAETWATGKNIDWILAKIKEVTGIEFTFLQPKKK